MNTGTSISLPAGAITGVAYLLCDSVLGNDPRFAQAGYSTGFVLVQDSTQGWAYFSITRTGRRSGVRLVLFTIEIAVDRN